MGMDLEEMKAVTEQPGSRSLTAASIKMLLFPSLLDSPIRFYVKHIFNYEKRSSNEK